MERLNIRMRSTLAKQVMDRSSKVLELHPGTSLVLPPTVLNTILQQIVLLAAPEPSGVRGGTLVVLFEPPHPANRYSTKVVELIYDHNKYTDRTSQIFVVIANPNMK